MNTITVHFVQFTIRKPCERKGGNTIPLGEWYLDPKDVHKDVRWKESLQRVFATEARTVEIGSWEHRMAFSNNRFCQR